MLTVLALAGCTSGEPGIPSSSPSASATPEPSATTEPVAPEQQGVTPVGIPTSVLTGLSAPWSVVRLDSGTILISLRDAGQVIEYSNGASRVVAKIAGSVHSGEGGLLGLATLEDGGGLWLYAYYTSASDNRIVRARLLGGPGSYSLGPEQNVLTGLARAGNHNGGRIAFGPDSKLYATVGDAGEPSRSQSMDSLNGKILRMNPDGSVPGDNPFPGSLIYTLGHRNPQGLAWDSSGQLWASEFGQNTWDEFNRIVVGSNYGWPIVEGKGGKAGFVDPVLQWSTDAASPSGLVWIDGTFFMAALGGRRLWVIQSDPISATEWFAGEYGRLRDAVAGPDGTLWLLTNNTDGRGSPKAGDDRLLQVRLEPLREG